MMDQRQRFVLTGSTVEFVGEAQKDDEASAKVINKDIYISPESLLNTKRYCQMLQTNVYQEKMVAFVIYEAHCVKTL